MKAELTLKIDSLYQVINDPNNLKKQELTAVKVAGKTQYLNGLQA